MRISRSVLREAGGETPPAYSPVIQEQYGNRDPESRSTSQFLVTDSARHPLDYVAFACKPGDLDAANARSANFIAPNFEQSLKKIPVHTVA